MDETKVLNHRTLLVERALGQKGNYAVVTKVPQLRDDIWRNLLKMTKGSVKNASDSQGVVNLNNGSKLTVLVNRTKDVPRWLKMDAVYFDGSFV